MASHLDESTLRPYLPAVEGAAPKPKPTPSDEVESIQRDLKELDTVLLRLVRHRIHLVKQLGAARVRAGGPRFVHEHELAVVRHFHQLGPAGRDLATILVRLGRMPFQT